MKTIIAGGRDITDYDVVELAINEAIKTTGITITEVVWGTQRGVDTLGKRWGDNHGIPVKPFYPDWDKLGLAAGPIRNREMAKYADALIAIWDGKSPGTKNMIAEATKRDLVIFVKLVRI